MLQILYVLGDQMGIIPKIAKNLWFCELWQKLLSLCRFKLIVKFVVAVVAVQFLFQQQIDA